jgi:hypothetical protein
MRHVLAVALVLGAAWIGARGLGLLVRGWRRSADAVAPLWIARGLRGVVVAIGALSLASGLLFGQTWLLVFGGVFLAEELYETGVVILVLRAGLRARGVAV